MADTETTACSFDLYPRPPYRLDLTAWTLRRRSRNEIDRWDGSSFRRALLIGDRAVAMRAVQHGTAQHPILHVDVRGADRFTSTELADLRGQVTRLLGIDVDVSTFYELADADPLTRPLKDRFLGMRPPRFPTLFEALANAVANQQLSLEVGLTLLNRLTAEFGAAAPGLEGLRAFPTPEAILAAPPDHLRRLGFSARKSDYLRAIALAIVTGILDGPALEGAERADATRRLMAIRGVGRWSAEYALLRGLGRLDVYPGDDVGARNKLRRFLGLDHGPGYDEIVDLLRPWEPCTGLLYFHLLLDGLAERGHLGGVSRHTEGAAQRSDGWPRPTPTAKTRDWRRAAQLAAATVSVNMPLGRRRARRPPRRRPGTRVMRPPGCLS